MHSIITLRPNPDSWFSGSLGMQLAAKELQSLALVAQTRIRETMRLFAHPSDRLVASSCDDQHYSLVADSSPLGETDQHWSNDPLLLPLSIETTFGSISGHLPLFG